MDCFVASDINGSRTQKNKIYLAFSRSANVKKDLINKVGENGSLRFGRLHASGGTGGFAF